MRLGFWINMLAQLLLLVLGGYFAFVEDATGTLALVAWCALGTVYAFGWIIALWISTRLRVRDDVGPGRLHVSVVARVLSVLVAVGTSLVGMVAAFQTLTAQQLRGSIDDDLAMLTIIIGVWAMLLSWALLHWAFAQLYQQQYWRSATPPLVFPETPRPRTIEFVYFAYLVATTFASTDVEVTTSRMRWTLLCHSVLSFFYNGVILLLAFNSFGVLFGDG